MRCCDERARRFPVDLVELPVRAHGVNEVVDGVNAVERGADRPRLEDVAVDHLGRPADAPFENLGAAREAAQGLAALLECA